MSTGLEALLALPLEVEESGWRELALKTRSGWRRRTTEIELRGAGRTGLGEDARFEAGHRGEMAWTPLAGEFRGTLEEYLAPRAGTIPLDRATAAARADEAALRWAFEAAAIDLALRQAGMGLAQVLGREERPLRYVLSGGLSRRAGRGALERITGGRSDVALKLDVGADWTPWFVGELRTLGQVRIVDCKGFATDPGRAPVGAELLRALFEDADWIVEDPPLAEDTVELVADHAGRVAWDAPLASAADLERAGFVPGYANLKPGRIGSLAGLLELAAGCRERGVSPYLGGSFELGVGRRQLQELGRLLCPTAPNDAAPAELHARGPSTRTALELPVPPAGPGFGR